MNITVLSVIEKFSYKEDLQEFGNFVQYLQKCLIWWSCFNWSIIHIFRQLSPYDLTRLLFPLQLRSIKFHFLPVFQSTFHFTNHRMTCKKFNLIAQMVDTCLLVGTFTGIDPVTVYIHWLWKIFQTIKENHSSWFINHWKSHFKLEKQIISKCKN